jgi:enediyne biosynthesis protein E4
MRRALVAAVALALSACSPEGATEVPAPTTVDQSSQAVPTESETGTAPTTTPGTSPTTSAPDDSATPSGSLSSTCWTAPVQPAGGGIVFEDATEAFGLVEPLTGMMGHAAAWADVDGDREVDLFVGTFANRPVEDYQVRGADGPGPDRVLLGRSGGFTDLGMDAELGRTSGAVFADLDLDGDVDLVISRNPRPGRERGEAPSTVYRNDDGTFVEVADAGLDPALGGRSIGVLDIDSDGLPDLILLEDKWTGGSTAVYRNLGGLRFVDATAEFGFPDDVHGLGIATADINGDGLTDVVIGGSNRVFVGTGEGLREIPGAIPEWEVFGNEDDVAGASIADVNGDGWPDLVLGHHYNSTLSRGTLVPIRLYLNRTGEIGGLPVFEDVTDRAGLIGLPTKAPHVAFVDLDNDGLIDILTSASAADGTLPAVFRNTGIVDGVPVFEAPAGLGSPQYWVAMPTADVDRDGRIDTLGVEWEPSLRSPLFHNRSASGHWLQVSVDETLGGGPGTVVAVYEEGGAEDPDRLLGVREITLSQGYSAGNEALAHFGLGSQSTVDVVVTPPLGAEPIVLASVGADQHLRLPNGC